MDLPDARPARKPRNAIVRSILLDNIDEELSRQLGSLGDRWAVSHTQAAFSILRTCAPVLLARELAAQTEAAE